MNLNNKEVEIMLMQTLSDVKEGFLEIEKEIIQEIEPNFKIIGKEDQVQFIKYLQQNFNDFQFIQNPIFQIQDKKIENFKEQYVSLKFAQNWKEFIQNLQNQQFCIENDIPSFWSTQDYIKLFSQFPEILPLFIKLKEFNNLSQGYNYVEIIKILLEAIEITQTNKKIEQNLIEQAVGQLLKLQLLQFSEYKHYLNLQSQEQYKKMIIDIQQFQLKRIEQIDQQKYEKPFQIFIQICTKNFKLNHIQKYLKDLFKIHDQSQENLQFSKMVDHLIYQNENIEACYYTLVFYFWLKYCNKFNFENDWSKFDSDMQKLVQDPQRQQIYLKRAQNRFSEIQDETYQFVVNILLFISELPYLDLKYIKDYQQNFQMEEYNNYKILNDFSNEAFQNIIQQTEKVEKALNSFQMVSFQKFPMIFKDEPNIFFKLQLSELLKKSNSSFEVIQKFVNQSQNVSLFEFLHFLDSNQKEIPSFKISYLLALVAHLKNFPLDQMQILIKLFQIEQTFQKGITLCKIQQITDAKIFNINNIPLKSMENLTIADWKISYQVLNYNLQVFFSKLFKVYQEKNLNQSQNQSLYRILKQLAPIFEFEYEEELFLIQKFIDVFSEIKFQQLFYKNYSQNIDDKEYEETVQILFQLFNQFDSKQIEKILESLQKLSKNDIYQFELMKQFIQKGFQNSIIQKTLLVHFYKNKKYTKEQNELCEQIFNENPQVYEQILAENNYFNNFLLHPKFLMNKVIQLKYPSQSEISLEDFNISLTMMSDQQKQDIVQKWINSMNDKSTFKQLIPLYFNVIKRKEQSKKLLSFFNNIKQSKERFNMKVLFQILFNNANNELKSMLLKLQCNISPLPLLYLNPNIYDIKEEKDLYCLNEKIMYIFPKCFPVISFSLSKQQSPIGKTSLINQVFYQQEIFEVRDNCKLSQNTVDIMFDFSFSGSRKFAIADIHGLIPFNILTKLLSLFQFWIVQMNTEEELKENFESIKLIEKQENIKIPECCFIVRNARNIEIQEENEIESQILQQKISIHKIMDLTRNDLDQQTLNSQIELFQKFIFSKIEVLYKNTQRVDALSNQKEFLKLLKLFYGNNSILVKEIERENQIINNLDIELNKFIYTQNGFYNVDAFPMRALAWQIKNLKEEQTKCDGLTPEEQQHLIDSKKKEIDILEQNTSFVKPSRILEIFQRLFQQKNYYILYLQFTDRIRKFNETHSFKLQDENQTINEKLSKLKLEKKKSQNNNQNQDKNKDKDFDQNQEQDQAYELKQDQDQQQLQILEQNVNLIEKNYKQEIEALKKQLEENLKQISLRNVGIELFWRELIAIRQRGLEKELDIDPVEFISKMIKKGEPFEFLDGDQLQIDQQFLTSLVKKFSDPDKEKILVLSILGPQSSGKSTILNKIFGSHFWTSVGRCTKGIYLQLLKISQKSYFDDLFDYILILDSEGLQNPNSNDPEFDKKIALFILAISDIILINVKGDIHSQFKNLIEMCIFTLGQMKSTISSVKQLSWCFNQNNDCENFQPFLQQIQSIVNALNLQINKNEIECDNQNLDYNEVLDIKKQNIKILGFASTEQSWRINQMNGVFENWRQQIVNETFSEEAYLFGVQMIQQFGEKFKAQSDKLMTMPSLSQFILNIESNWQSICRLPDLLEFTELLQYKQDQLMKQEFDLNYKKFNLDFHLNIPRKIQSELPKGKINLDFFRKSEELQKEYIKTEIQVIQSDLKEKLLQIKSQNQIQKKIYSKYIKMLEERLQSYSYQCELVIFDEIKKHETEFQQKKGFLQIENLVSQISQDNSTLQQLKGHPELIKITFDAKWSEIIDQSIERQENVLRDFSIAQYQTIYSSFSQYHFKSDQQKDFQSKFLKGINKNSPFKQNENEKLQTYLIFKNEFKKQQQFKCLQKEITTIKYLDIFHQKISDRLNNSSDQNIINMNIYYHLEVQFIQIKKSDFQNYLQQKIFDDFWYFIKKSKQKQTLKDCEQQVISEFFQILIFCSVEYKQQQYENLIKWMQEGWSLKFWKNDEELLKEQFDKLQQTFKFNQNTEIYIESQEHAKYLSYNYPNLKSEKKKYYANNENEFQNLISEQTRECIIFLSQKDIIPKNQEYQNRVLLYISDQKKNSQFQKDFNQNGVKQFEEIMDEQQGWVKLYSQIYDIIKSEMIKLNQNKKQIKNLQFDFFEEEEIVSSDMNLIQIIMSKIEQNIIKFNKEFSNFGVILKDVGERCIYYYSIFIIWRFQCYKEWKSLEENQNRLKNMKDEQLQKFTADIEQNKSEQSILNAQALAKNIKQDFLDRFYQENLAQISKSIMSNNISCYDLVKQLDKDVLENYHSTNQKNDKWSNEEILNYIIDQKQFIEKRVDFLLTEIEEKVKTDFENQLREELKQYMKLLYDNIEIIYNYVSPQKEPVKTEEYFDYNEAELNTQNCESQLFQLIQNCIQGENLNQVNGFKINYNFRDIFEGKQYNNIRVLIFNKTSNQSEQEIKLLKPFIQELFKQIKDFMEKSDNEQIMLRNNFIQHCWNKLKLDMNGCQHSCPMCKRKCDQPNDSNHKHSCRNGHQLRGMNGVLIENNPSLFTCEEIPDEAEISTLETNVIKKWREIQKAYNDWIFKDLKDNEIKLVKEKMVNVWNNGIGQLVCNYLKVKLKNENIIFQKKTEIIHHEFIHYIMILDDSGSMAGKKWEKAKKGALDCLIQIGKNPYAKVSVIIFNGLARVVINCEKVDILQQQRRINFQGGGTNFGKAFSIAYNQLNANKNLNFNKTILIFYTDGGGEYPEKEVKQFCILPNELKRTMQLICCSETELKQNACLIKITDMFKRNEIFAELKSNVKVDDITKVFTEIVSQSYHNLKC